VCRETFPRDRSPFSSATSRGRRGCSRSSGPRDTRRRSPTTAVLSARLAHVSTVSRLTPREMRSSLPSRQHRERSRRLGPLAKGSRLVRSGCGWGLHTGTPLVTDEGYVGADVHRAARIAASGHGRQVLVSASTAGLLDLELQDLAEHRFKDLAAPERVFQLGDGAYPPLRSLRNVWLPVPATPFLGRERGFKPFLRRHASRHRQRAPPYQGGALPCQERQQKAAICSGFVVSKEPSDGLEPSTPSLPWRFSASAAGRRNRASRLGFLVSVRLGGALGLFLQPP
jgi:hypothetical protein